MEKPQPNNYVNITNTTYFSKMTEIPNSTVNMRNFLSFHDGEDLFNDGILEKICDFYEMSTLQLDALFVFARSLHNFFKEIISTTQTILKDALPKFNLSVTDFDPEFIKLLNYPEVFVYMFRYILEYMDNEVSYEKFINMVRALLENINSSGKIKFLYSNEVNINEQFKQLIQFVLFKPSIEVEQFTKLLYEKIIDKFYKSWTIGKQILNLCATKNLTDNDKSVLECFVKTNHVDILDYQTDHLLNGYYDYYADEAIEYSQNNTDLFDDMFWNTSVMMYQSHDENDKIKIAVNNKLSSIGYELGPILKNRWIHTILDCFIEHQFALSVAEIVQFISQIFLLERETPGYTNKYDEMTLYDHFTLICMANDIPVTYDNFVQQIQVTGKLPTEYPFEIIMRVLSRMYNVDIMFYSNHLTPLCIENTIPDYSFGQNKPIEMITIYQSTLDSFYNIIPIGSQWEPINSQTGTKININNGVAMDIVEV